MTPPRMLLLRLSERNRDFLIRVLEREIKRARRAVDPTYKPAPGKQDANLGRIAHLEQLIGYLREEVGPLRMRCSRCHRPMAGTTAYDGACECGGLIEREP